MSEPRWIADISEEYNGYLYEIEALLDGKQAGDVRAIIYLLAHVRELRAALFETIHTPFETWPYAQRDNHHLLSREVPPEVKP